MQGVSPNGVFCDFLNVTASTLPGASFSDDLIAFLGEMGIEPRGRSDLFTDGDIVVKLRTGKRWESWSLPGKLLSKLRKFDGLSDLLSIIAAYPHRVSTVDLATDVRPPGRTSDFLQVLHQRGLSGVSLGRKEIPREKINVWLAPTVWDGSLSGTVYWGNRRTDRFYFRAYDKRKEIYDRTGTDTGDELVRLEVRAGKRKACLRDVMEPDALFFDLCAPDALSRPAGVPDWEYAEWMPLNLPPRQEAVPVQKAKRILGVSPDLKRLATIAANASPEDRAYIRSLLVREFDTLVDSCQSGKTIGKGSKAA